MSILGPPPPFDLVIPLRPARRVLMTVPADFKNDDLLRLEEVLHAMFPPTADGPDEPDEPGAVEQKP